MKEIDKQAAIGIFGYCDSLKSSNFRTNKTDRSVKRKHVKHILHFIDKLEI